MRFCDSPSAVPSRVGPGLGAPPVRMEFRNLTEDMLKPGVAVAVEGFPSKRTADELRADGTVPEVLSASCGH